MGLLKTIRIWADMVKVSHSIFALPFALIAAFLAGRHMEHTGRPEAGQLALIVLCMVAARSVAMTFNRIADASIDARNPRTSGRPLPAGRLSLTAAWMMMALSGVTFGLGCLGFFIFYDNTWPILLSGPVLVLLCGYSLTKRFTRYSHFYLGGAIAMSPVATWVAIHPSSVGLAAWTLMAIVALWIAGFDIIYACQDIAVDREEGLFSLPSRSGPTAALWVARGAHVCVVGGLIGLGIVADLGAIYAAGVVVVALLLFIENALVRAGDYSKVNLAFFTINGVVSLLLAISVIADVLIAPAPV